MDEEPEKQPQELGSMVSDPTLFNIFWLNEIKSLDDTSRILLSVTILSLSAYLTVIAANFDKMTVSLNIAPYYLIKILTIPFFSWILCLLMLTAMHVGPTLDTVPLLDINVSKRYLVFIYKYKYLCLLNSYMLLFLPFIYLAIPINGYL